VHDTRKYLGARLVSSGRLNYLHISLKIQFAASVASGVVASAAYMGPLQSHFGGFTLADVVVVNVDRCTRLHSSSVTAASESLG
jgi:hypothetical protein